MKSLEIFLLSVSWREYILLTAFTGFAYCLLKPFEWDYLRAPVSIGLFILLLLIKFVTRIDYLRLCVYCFEAAFIEVWCGLCFSIFHFSMYYGLKANKPLLYQSVVGGCIIFFLLFFFKQMIRTYI